MLIDTLLDADTKSNMLVIETKLNLGIGPELQNQKHPTI
jgi:hypothetical protein